MLLISGRITSVTNSCWSAAYTVLSLVSTLVSEPASLQLIRARGWSRYMDSEIKKLQIELKNHELPRNAGND